MCKGASTCGGGLAVSWHMGGPAPARIKHSLKHVQGIASGEHAEDIIVTSTDQGVLVIDALTKVRALPSPALTCRFTPRRIPALVFAQYSTLAAFHVDSCSCGFLPCGRGRICTRD